MALTAAELTVVWLSLKVAMVATLVSAVPAIAVAWLLARRRFWGRTALNVLVHIPLVVPPVVTGYFLLRVLGRRGLIGEWLDQSLGLQFSFRWTGAAVAAAVMAFPLVVRAIRLGFEGVDRKVEESAATLGASPWRVFLTITLPLALPGLAAGLLIGFAKALGEFGATITFVSNIPGETQTLALAIYTQLERPGGEDAATRLVWLSVALSVLALVVSELMTRGRQRIDT
ncbi:MAG TPA: molybdate ABC transporter permease subunit [Vicinamibacterales bacterium]|nr:molybdate ABC transporter permease subunit [Vicinamibacterales bacterium]